MPLTVRLFGDRNESARQLSVGTALLKYVKDMMTLTELPTWGLERNYDDLKVKVSSINILPIETLIPGQSSYDTIEITTRVKKRVVEVAGKIYIICIPGTTTRIHDERLYYRLEGNVLIKSSKPNIIDDGKYVSYTNPVTFNIDVFYEDPDDYLYRYIGDGIGVASVANGIAAKRSNNRIILNEAMEDEVWWGYTVTMDEGGGNHYIYKYLRHFDSLIGYWYGMQGRPFVSRYINDGVLYMSHEWSDTTGEGVLSLKYFVGEYFEDILPIVHKVYKKTFEGVKTSLAIEGTEDFPDPALLVAANFSNNNSVEKILRGNAFYAWADEDTTAEPMMEENYDIKNLTHAGIQDFHRCVSGDLCGTWQNALNFDIIRNDVKLPYDIDGDGKLTYIRIEKDTPITKTRLSLFVSDIEVLSSGWEDVVSLCEGETYAPYYAWKTRYKILQNYQDDNFKAILFRKTVYQDYDSELLNYVWQEPTYPYGYYYIRLNKVQTKTTYHICVNGVITDLKDSNNNPYECLNTEQWLTGSNVEKVAPPYNVVALWVQTLPYLDAVGKNVTRIFTTATSSKLLINFDVFDVNVSHNIVYNAYHNLLAEYDDSTRPFPPSSDLQTTVQDRKWLLFNIDGSFSELTLPEGNPETLLNLNRVNGLGIMEMAI